MLSAESLLKKPPLFSSVFLTIILRRKTEIPSINPEMKKVTMMITTSQLNEVTMEEITRLNKETITSTDNFTFLLTNIIPTAVIAINNTEIPAYTKFRSNFAHND